jgi:osmotically-inducible protein OsmY
MTRAMLNGWVTPTGDVDVPLQSDVAFDHVAGLRGVTGVTNEIEVGRGRRTRDRLTEMVVPDSHSFRRSRR